MHLFIVACLGHETLVCNRSQQRLQDARCRQNSIVVVNVQGERAQHRDGALLGSRVAVRQVLRQRLQRLCDSR